MAGKEEGRSVSRLGGAGVSRTPVFPAVGSFLELLQNAIH